MITKAEREIRRAPLKDKGVLGRVDINTVKLRIGLLKSMSLTDDIRRLMLDEGAMGIRYEANMCPVANYLRKGLEVDVKITDETIYVGDALDTIYCDTWDNEAVSWFIDNFDAGAYPELDVTLTKPTGWRRLAWWT